jgi:hypothetical protein
LIFVPFDLPLRGYITLWSIAIVVLGFAFSYDPTSQESR